MILSTVNGYNISNDFPGGGKTITLGPGGMVAHPNIITSDIIVKKIRSLFIALFLICRLEVLFLKPFSSIHMDSL